MLLACKCPSCGQEKQYIAELVGSTANCDRCGAAFELKGNPGRVFWHVALAAVVVVATVLGFFGRAALRSQRWQRIHEQRSRERGLLTPAEPRLFAQVDRLPAEL